MIIKAHTFLMRLTEGSKLYRDGAGVAMDYAVAVLASSEIQERR
jgi:hypothetical protein